MPEAACLALADRHAAPDAIRAAPRSTPESDALCEGLALLAEKKAADAIARLTAAAAQMGEDDRWAAQGHIARGYALDGKPEMALRDWDEAIEGATRAGHLDRQNLFRADRGILYAQQGQFGPALADFDTVYRQAAHPRAKSEMAYQALKVSISGGNRAAAEHWYPLAVRAAEAAGDAEKLAYATEIFGQMLDKQGDHDASAKIYDAGVERIERSGSKFLHAELMEFQGQSRFAAGDYRGGERAYAQAAEMYRQAGRAEYAAFLEKNLRSNLGRYEAGHACEALVEEGRYDVAAAAVADIPAARRRFGARTCLVRALDGKGDPGRARRELDILLAETGPDGWPCDELKALARQIGVEPVKNSPPPGPLPSRSQRRDRSDPPPRPTTCQEAMAEG